MRGFLALMLAPVLSAGAYDLNVKTLTPVDVKPAPKHEPLKLVENGKLNFAVAVDLRCPPVNSWFFLPALTNAFARTTGTCPDVINAAKPEQYAKYRYVITLADGELAKAQGLDCAAMPTQAFAVKTYEKGIVIAGHDAYLVKDWWKNHPNYSGSRGTEYGVLDFTERVLGVRYYFPGPYGTVFPKITDLTVAPMWYEDRPVFDRRDPDRYYLTASVGWRQQAEKWEPYMGPMKVNDMKFAGFWRLGGSLPYIGRHCPEPRGFAKAYSNDLKTVFYTDKTGKLYHNPKEHIGNYFNVFDLKFADLLVDGWHRFFDSKGKDNCGFGRFAGRRYLNFGVCDMALPTAITKDLDMPNVYGKFYKYLGEKVKKDFPQVKLYTIAYCDGELAPTKYVLPDNIEVSACKVQLPLKVRDAKTMERMRKELGDWSKALGGRPIGALWLYSNGLNPFARAVGPGLVGEVPKALGSLLGRDEMFYDYWGCEDLWHYYFSLYLMYKSMWNPAFDTAAALDELWELMYGGEAAEHMRKFYRILMEMHEKVYCADTATTDAYPVYPRAYLDGLLDELDAALAAVKGDEVRTRRVKLVADFFRKHVETQRARAAYVAPVYEARHLLKDEKPVLDGKPDEAFWKDVKPVPLMHPKGQSLPAEGVGEIRLVWDEKGLYGSFTAKGKSISDPKKALWANDNLEMLFMPGAATNRQVNYHFAADTLGQTFTSKKRYLPIEQPSDNTWKTPGSVFRFTRSEKGYAGEFFIPFAVFDGGAPGNEDEWAMNLVQNRPGQIYAGSALTLGNQQNIHSYGVIRFIWEKELVWADEFDGTALDETKWTPEIGFVRNKEAQYYTGRKENVRVEDGCLVLEGRKEEFPNAAYDPAKADDWKCAKTAHYTSGSITTKKKFDFTYGHLEVRAKLPTGRGVWPAIWTIGSCCYSGDPAMKYPKGGEIDIMEHVGYQPPNLYATVHWQDRKKPGGMDRIGTYTNWAWHGVRNPTPQADFHLYSMEWDDEKIEIFFDNHSYLKMDIARAEKEGFNPFKNPHVLLLNFAIGGGWGGSKGIDDSVFPQKYLIDYVRLYQRRK